MKQVFLSYSHRDQKAAEALYCALHAPPRLRVWMDHHNLKVGLRWEPEVRKAIRESRYFIALLSRRSLRKRAYQRKELRDAVQILREFPAGQVFLLVARLEPVIPSDKALKSLHRADLFPDWNAGLAALRKSLGVRLASRTPPVARGASRTEERLRKAHHYHIALYALDKPEPSLRAVARTLSSVQEVFGFHPTRATTTVAARRRIESDPHLALDRLDERFYQRLALRRTDYAFGITERFLVQRGVGRGFLQMDAPGHERVRFISTGGLEEYAAEAGVSFHGAIAYLTISAVACFFLNLDYHPATRGCPMDFVGEHAAMVEGLRHRRFCGACSRILSRKGETRQALDAMLGAVR